MSAPTEAARFVALASREIHDGQVCFVGIGVPSLAAMTAKRTHAPNLVLIYESGAIDADPPVPPLSTGSPSVMANTAMATSCLGVFAMLQQGRFDIGLLSGAQVDRFGNLNSTALGPKQKPKVRLVGSGGAHDIAVLAREITIMMPHDPRRFVKSVDFITSPGLRDAAARMRGRGPVSLVTPRARFTFAAGELTLDGIAPGYEEKDAVEGIGWAVPRAPALNRLPDLSANALEAAQHYLDLWGRDAV
jgi:glutaconate CoA-transferase, subunit B